MKGKKQWVFNIAFLLLVLLLTFYGLFHSSDLSALQSLLQQADVRWWILGFALVVAFILGESMVLHDILRSLHTPHRLQHCFLYSFIGFFFSCITPSAGGGQPAQVYFMRKDGIDAAVSVPVMILVTITYKLVLVLFALGGADCSPRLGAHCVKARAAMVYAWGPAQCTVYQLLYSSGDVSRCGRSHAPLVHPPPRSSAWFAAN